MILEKFILITLNGRTSKFWIDKGYVLPEYIDSRGRKQTYKKGAASLLVKIKDLPLKSNVRITAICETCGEPRYLPYVKYSKICWSCNLNKQKGMDHPKWLHRVKTGGAERAFDLYLQRKYGITSKHYYKMFAAQKYKCAICRKPQSIDGRKFAVDHIKIQEVLKVRGILCQACNTAIGLLQENHNLIHIASEYVQKEGISYGKFE